MKKKIDCITFFNENLMFDLRFKTLENFFDFFLICEAKHDHKGNKKKLNFNLSKYSNNKKIIYIIYEEPFKRNNTPWENQAKQRDFILKNLSFVEDNDYIFFSDPDEIPNPDLISNFNLSKKYGIFLQKCYNYKFNLFNPYETPWEGTRVSKKKDLKSIDYLRQKIKLKNLKYKFYRIDKEKNIEIFNEGGWHFNNIMDPEEISLKLKTFAHSEFSSDKFSNPDLIKKKIDNKNDLFERNHVYEQVLLDKTFPNYLTNNKEKYKKFIL